MWWSLHIVLRHHPPATCPFHCVHPLNSSFTTFPFPTVSATIPSTCLGSTRPYHKPCPASGDTSPLTRNPGGRYTITFPANLWPPIWLTSPTWAPTSLCKLLLSRALRNSACRSGPRMPHRWSRPPWPQMRTIGALRECVVSGFGPCGAATSTLERTKCKRPDGERSMCGTCWKAGKRYTDAVLGATVGKLAFVMRMGWLG